MASIKQRKSKGKAECLSVIGDGLSYGYEVRKMNALGNTRSHLVRPLRTIRKVYEQALSAWSREADAFNKGQGQLPLFPNAEEALYRRAAAAAKRGDGVLVARLAGIA